MLLDAHAAAVADRVIAEESVRRAHVVVYLSGAHAYGFPSADSDLDLKAIHLAETEELMGLSPPVPAFDRAEIIDGVEIDYTSNEAAHALNGILRGNGNFLERVLGATVLARSPWLEELAPIVQRSLSRRVHAHYRGFARSQEKELATRPTVKRLLYVVRTTLTGTHLLQSGRLVTDVNVLGPEHGVVDIASLVARKRDAEQTPLAPAEIEEWRPRVAELFAKLDAAREASPLPEEPPNVGELEHWLVRTRVARR